MPGIRFLSSLLCFLPGLLLLLALAPFAQAQPSLTSVREGQLPATEASALFSLGGQLLASNGQQLQQLSADGQHWQPLTLPAGLAPAQIQAAAGNGNQGWLLLAGAQPALMQVRLQRDQLQALGQQPLPDGLAQPVIGMLGDELLLAGTDTGGQPQLHVADAQGRWRQLPPWLGNAPPQAVQGNRGAVYLADSAGQWQRYSKDQGWQYLPASDGRVVPGSLRQLGQAHLLMLVRQADERTVLRSFHTITSAWYSIQDLPGAAPAAVAAYGNGLAWQADGGLAFGELEGSKHLLRSLDWVVITLYLAAMLGMGFWFYLKDQNSSTADYFVGGRSIPFWVAGISLYATNTSSISFIAIPAKAFDTNWQYLTNNLMAVCGLVFVAIWIVPILRRLDLMSVFSYLETRFHPAIRLLSSALCIVMQIGSRMSVILFLPALAIATITGLDVAVSILIMGVFTIIYSTIGGSKAVIWTDVIQVFVMFGGALFAIGYVFWQSGTDLPQLMSAVAAEDKTRLFDFSFDLTKATVWGFIFLVIFDVVLTFPKDQVLMQRALSTKDDKAAGRSIWTFAAIMVPGGFVFYGIGTALWMYYRNNPERLNPLLPIDATFPLFIAAELPAGVTGLIIAGIFAAAMSTLSSIINSVGTLISVDFYQKLAKAPNEKTAVRIAEWAGVGVGLFGIGIALLMSRYDIDSLFDVSIELAGLLGGGFAGAYTLGMFTRRANAGGVAIGVAGSILITLACWWFDLVHPYFYLGISIALCIVIGYLASFLFPPPAQSLEGLTIHGQGRRKST